MCGRDWMSACSRLIGHSSKFWSTTQLMMIRLVVAVNPAPRVGLTYTLAHTTLTQYKRRLAPTQITTDNIFPLKNIWKKNTFDVNKTPTKSGSDSESRGRQR